MPRDMVFGLTYRRLPLAANQWKRYAVFMGPSRIGYVIKGRKGWVAFRLDGSDLGFGWKLRRAAAATLRDDWLESRYLDAHRA